MGLKASSFPIRTPIIGLQGLTHSDFMNLVLSWQLNAYGVFSVHKPHAGTSKCVERHF